MPKDTLIAHCMDLALILTDQISSDIDRVDVSEELTVLSPFLHEKLTPKEVFEFITKLNFDPTLKILQNCSQWREIILEIKNNKE